VAYPLFQAGGGGSSPTAALSSAKQLRLELIPFADAKALNRLWHSRLPRFGTGFVEDQPFLSFGAEYGGLWYAAGIWSNPVARLLPQDVWLELRRLAIADDAPRNTASRMLRVMALVIRRHRPEVRRLVSYQDTEVHTGAIYRAAGWTRTAWNGDGNWNRPGRSRPKAQSEAPKQRWEKVMHGNIKWTELNPAERKRTYHFPGGDSISFENVVRIEVRDSGKHRIETADGRKAFVCPGWLWMEIDVPEWTC
jgi:hypothetical protein